MAAPQRTANSIIFGKAARTLTSGHHFVWTAAQNEAFEAHATAHLPPLDRFEDLPQLLSELGLHGFRGLSNAAAPPVLPPILPPPALPPLGVDPAPLAIPALRTPRVVAPPVLPPLNIPTPPVLPSLNTNPAPLAIPALRTPQAQARLAELRQPHPPNPAPRPRSPAGHVDVRPDEIKQEPDSDDDWYGFNR
ncbi:hypothetical protein NPX13_g9309 [Xylaria arbuscula]|uniref:Uncharacterized protein n=1 Tax=Xylaria arbuscula TaxID=114810 RepID=A0A9W8N6M4_9PEZI|nr:hypothetical protein NPX13_g9309 [Xylaria arbuscula]